ncbi:NAD-dependent epimerase/dehydratase family protein [Variovorax sp. HJSM1_2]|uniref:NAD-dependent epimerase/dehydratase family protein n=1 Tax=Variovorax sp. HJSM1_2 TaxID=3366263 RepID=UPI003BD1F1BB
MKAETIVLTGAAGRIGRLLRPSLAACCAHLRLVDQAPVYAERANESAFQCDLGDSERLLEIMQGSTAVVHFAGYPREAEWSVLLSANVVGAVNLWEAARLAGVKRVVYASSNHAVGFYPRSEVISHQSLPAPDSRYGVTKVFMESLAGLYAAKHGIRGFGMRIGHCSEKPTDARMLSHWVHPQDLAALVQVGLSADYLHELVYGVSANSLSWWSNERAQALGYRPQKTADVWIGELQSLVSHDPVAEHFQGGSFASAEFQGASPLRSGAQP